MHSGKLPSRGNNMNERNRVFDIIIDFIKAVQSEEQAVVYHNKEATYKIVGPKYLLGQIIRQYELPLSSSISPQRPDSSGRTSRRIISGNTATAKVYAVPTRSQCGSLNTAGMRKSLIGREWSLQETALSSGMFFTTST